MAVMKVLDTVTIKGSAESVYNEFLKYIRISLTYSNTFFTLSIPVENTSFVFSV